jgi:hypothetical protein
MTLRDAVGARFNELLCPPKSRERRRASVIGLGRGVANAAD